MKKLILMLPLVFGCKTSKQSCDAYGAYRIPYTDSIVVSEYHVMPLEYKRNKNLHLYFPKEIVYIKDGVEVCIPVHYEYQRIIKYK